MNEIIALEAAVISIALALAIFRICGDVRKIRLHLIPPPVKAAKAPKAVAPPEPVRHGFVPPPIRTPDPAR